MQFYELLGNSMHLFKLLRMLRTLGFWFLSAPMEGLNKVDKKRNREKRMYVCVFECRVSVQFVNSCQQTANNSSSSSVSSPAVNVNNLSFGQSLTQIFNQFHNFVIFSDT